MTYETLHVQLDSPFLTVTLNRPAVRNAMNQAMVRDLLDVFTRYRDDRSVRAIVIQGAQGTFCAGGDIKEMQAAYTDPTTNEKERTRVFDDLLITVNSAPQVVIAAIDGAAMGGGFGLVCVSDIAVATEDAIFALPEVRLGLVPALISPYVIARLGLTQARRLMLTGARFDGHEALTYGLVHDVCPAEQLPERLQIILNDLMQASPHALAACKALMFHVTQTSLAESVTYRADLLNTLRQGPSGQEGMMAFIQKRKPRWAQRPEEAEE